jgi:hyperosmotically inducible periplasmic protein
MKRGILAGLVMISLAAAPAFAESAAAVKRVDVRRGVGLSDAALADKVASKIRRYVNYSIFDDVNIAVDNGLVTLSGRVTMPYKATDMARLVARIDGVVEVHNEIGVLPVSIHDDRLRHSLARQIYRDPVFSRYAIQVNPPIHIVVEHGRVTLTGWVNSRLERQKAEFIARSTFGVFNVENRLQIDS